MASGRRRRPEGIEFRARSNGSTAYRVAWHEGGCRDGQRRSWTFDDLNEAVAFRGALVANGYRDPYDDPEWAARLGLAAQPSLVRSFAMVAEEYLATLVDAAARTLAEYRRDLATHVCPAVVVRSDGRRVGPLGRCAIDVVDTEVVQGWVGYMRTKVSARTGKRYSAKTILNIHGSVVAPVFEFAAVRGYIGVNPCRAVRLPERRGRAVSLQRVAKVGEMAAWIECAYAVDVDTGDITALVLGTGLRWGELTALRVCDVDFSSCTVSIMQVVKEDENRRPYIDTVEGKSPNAFRTVGVGVVGMEILRSRCVGRSRSDLLFPAPGNRGGVLWRNANFHSHRWVKVRKLAAARGLFEDPSPHALRHSHATALIPLVGIETVSKRLGHANVTVTSAIYSHLTPEVDARTGAALDHVLAAALRRRPEPPAG